MQDCSEYTGNTSKRASEVETARCHILSKLQTYNPFQDVFEGASYV
jgi:hypothetical protein